MKNNLRHNKKLQQAMKDCLPQKQTQNKLAVGILSLGLALSVVCPVNADTFTVMNTNDSGPGSLRQAILDAESNPGKDTINFSSVTGDIATVTPLPGIHESVDINGPGRDAINIKDKIIASTTLNDELDISISDVSIDGIEAGMYYQNFYNSPNRHKFELTVNNVLTKSIRTVNQQDYYNSDVGSGVASINNSVISGSELGIYNSRWDLSIENSSITNNNQAANVREGNLFLVDSVVSGNASGISNFGGYVSAENTVFTDNESALYTSFSNINYNFKYGLTSLNNCTLSNNSGVVLNVVASRLLITNTTISENNGVAIYGSPDSFNFPAIADITINASTITGNQGGVIGKQNTQLGMRLAIHNSIISDNSVGDFSDVLIPDTTYFSDSANIDHSLIEDIGDSIFNDVVTGSNLIGIDPLLAPLADNGGPTKTHALLAGSPAIDSGDAANCTVTDQRGVVRPQGAGCDMGAYEVEDVVVPPVVICDIGPVSVGGNCADEVVARSMADIDAYVASNFGRHTLANGKQAYKNLRLVGNLGQAGVPLTATSPCAITVNANASIIGSDVSLHARQGLSVNWSADLDATGEACLISDKKNALLNGGNTLNANTLAIRGNKKAVVGFQSAITVNGESELVSTGAGESSQAKVGNKTSITAESFTMKADNIAELAYEADITTTGVLSITSGSLPTSEVRLTNRSNVQAGTDLTLTSQDKTTIGYHATVTAGNNLDVNASSEADCSVASITSVSYSSKSGNCSDKLP